MFATIETNGATHIAIHIPHAGAEKSLPALAAMLEQNAVFIRQGYQQLDTVKPKMAITLGDSFSCENYEVVIAVTASTAAPSPEFVPATPAVFVDVSKLRKAKDDEISRLRTELTYVKQQRDALQAAADAHAEAQ